MWNARVINNVVDHVVKVDPFTIFPSEYAELFIEVPERTEVGYIYDGVNFNAPVYEAPPAPTKEQLLNELAQLTLKIQSLEV